MAAWQEPTECCFVTLLKFNGWNLKTVASKRNLQKSMGWCSGSKLYFRGVVFLCCWFIICLFGLVGIWFESSTLIYPLCRPWCLMMLNDSSKNIKKNMDFHFFPVFSENTNPWSNTFQVLYVEARFFCGSSLPRMGFTQLFRKLWGQESRPNLPQKNHEKIQYTLGIQLYSQMMMMRVSNHLLRIVIIQVPLPFSGGDWIPRVFWDHKRCITSIIQKL